MSDKLEINLNLHILPLNILENIVTQKCLIPKIKFPAQMKPGSWVKCVLDNGSIVVCQVFARDMPGKFCYMDSVVNECGLNTRKPDKSAKRKLERLEVLTNQQTPATEVGVVLTITEKLFLKNIDKLNLEYLATIIQQLVQSLYLIQNCTIEIPELFQMGIEAVQIKFAKGCAADAVFQITDATIFKIIDVNLQPTLVHSNTFHAYGFESALKELEDLVQVAEMQRSRCFGKFRISLNALLVGPTGCGKSALAAEFIRRRNCNCFYITATNVLGQYPGEAEAELRRIFQAARIFAHNFKPTAPVLIVVEDLQLLCPAARLGDGSSDANTSMHICAQLLSLIDELHQSENSIICLATTSTPEALNGVARRPGRFDQEISIAAPTESARRLLFAALFDETYIAHHLAGEVLTPELLDAVSKHTQGYVVADLALLISNIEKSMLSQADSGNIVATVKSSLANSQPICTRNTDVTVAKMTVGFDTIGGMTSLKQILKVSVLASIKQRNAFQRFDLTLPKGVLLYGPPGCAKTTIAKCLAYEAGFNFISTSGAEVYSPYVGCAEKFIAKMFNAARKHAPCVMFLDEIDTLVGQRSLVSNATSDVQIRILSTLLTEMDGIIATDSDNHILVVAATNRPDMVDDALLRPGRFDKLIHVPAPDCESRLALLELHAKRMPFADDVDLCDIAKRTQNYSGADICNLCNEAALKAFQHDFNAMRIVGEDFEKVLATHTSSLTQRQIDWYFNFERKFLT